MASVLLSGTFLQLPRQVASPRGLRWPSGGFRLSLALSLCAGWFLAGCNEATKARPSPVGDLGAGLLSILHGQLHEDPASGCVWVGKKTGGDEVRWPRGYRIELRPLRLVQSGRVIARSGDRLRLGGGLDFRYPRSRHCVRFTRSPYKFTADHVLRVTRR